MGMLVLSRRIGETIFIDGDIRVTVLSVGATSVRIGIDAPKEVDVHRAEVHDRINGTNSTISMAEAQRRPRDPNRIRGWQARPESGGESEI